MPPDLLFLALFLGRVPASIRDHLAAANHKAAGEMASHADILWDARWSSSVAAVWDFLSTLSVRSASPKASRSPERRRARSPDRNRGEFPRRLTPAKDDNRSGNSDGKLCFYHD